MDNSFPISQLEPAANPSDYGVRVDDRVTPVNESFAPLNAAIAQLPQFSEAELALLGGDRKIKQRPEKGLELAERIVKAAEESRGEYLWYPDHAKITENGNLGCAISVVRVLQKAGYPVQDETGVRNLVRALGWSRINDLSKAQPGDLVVGHNKQGGNHIGIVGRGGGVWNNSWRAIPTNTWVNEPMSFAIRPGWMWGGYTERYLLRPPKK